MQMENEISRLKKSEDVVGKARFYSALSDPVRLKILRFLMSKDCSCICEITKHVGRDQSVVFRHIMTLKKADIIETKKFKNFLFCCIKDKIRIRRFL